MGKKRHFRGRPNTFLTEDDKKNDLFHHYYKTQFNWDEEQMKQFYDTMLQELPATFRVTGFRQHSKEVLWLIKNQFLDQLIDEKRDENGSVVIRGPLAKALSWYPKEMAWQLNASKIEIRKTPELKRLHKFMISETDCGFISRQEAVSMIPPLLLDIESHHKVLDLCAAPGSKTAQLLEMLHANSESVPTGVVVANDIDSKRCYMMVHQLQRLQSPCVVVVRQDASIFPKMYLDPSRRVPMQFDRILADVPCSGDGTLRKNPDLWPRWNPFLGVNEHFLQMKILRRSLEMLAEGGRMVYSTCSLNPIEDEAVIAAILTQCQGSVRLVDIRIKLTGLVSEPGLTSWKVMLKDKTWCASQEDVPAEQRRSFRSTLFPPADVDQLNLEYCRRVFPQLQNTGGFFIALLEKVSCIPWMNAAKSALGRTAFVYENPNDESATLDHNGEIATLDQDGEITTLDQNGEVATLNQDSVFAILDQNGEILARGQNGEFSNLDQNVEFATLDQNVELSTLDQTNKPVKEVSRRGRGKKEMRVFKEDPFYYVEDGDQNWAKVQQYYDIDADFPHWQLMYRSAEGKRRFYYFTNDLVKQLVQQNYDTGINFVNLGVKTFGISEDKLFRGYRLLQEGLEIVEPFIGVQKQRMTIACKVDLMTLLGYDMPLITSFSAAMQSEFGRFVIGPVLFEYDPAADTTEDGGPVTMPRIRLVFAGWRGRSSLRHYVGVHERSHLLRLCGVEPVEVVEAPRWQDNEAEQSEQ